MFWSIMMRSLLLSLVSLVSFRNSYYRIATEVAAAAVSTEVATPCGIELLDERFDRRRIVGENSILEVALLHFCTHPCISQVGRSLRVKQSTRNHYIATGTSYCSMTIGVEVAIPLRSIVVSQWNFTGKPAGSL